MAPTATAARPQTAQLLVLLHDYVRAHAPRHPALLPAVLTLREAAQSFGRGEVQAAFDRGITAFQIVERARAASRDLPVP